MRLSLHKLDSGGLGVSNSTSLSKNFLQPKLQFKLAKKNADKSKLQIFFVGKLKAKAVRAALKSWLHERDLILWEKSPVPWAQFSGIHSTVVLIAPFFGIAPKFYTPRNFRPSDYSLCRDSVGKVGRDISSSGAELHFLGCTGEQAKGFLTGLQTSAYRFKDFFTGSLQTTKIKPSECNIHVSQSKFSADSLVEAQAEALGINFARTLVNLAPSDLEPKNYVQLLQSVFKGGGFSSRLYNPKSLEQLGFGLITGVGQGAETGPYILHLRYRSSQAKKKAPVAFIGKGITFDTGGLDIKPADGMRLMKKDMGGSAALAGVALWAKLMRPKINLDFYFAIAENAVSAKSFKPGDVLVAKNGLRIEIDNTDAEGRLVLADAMTLALENKEKPETLIDVATLTGAIKVGLGPFVAGLFSNDDKLSQQLLVAGQQAGEKLWEMPLDQALREKLESPAADMVNSAPGFGGAITAALFLESFVGNCKWAHLDIYAWNDRPYGALCEIGGNGQAVQTLIAWLASKRS